MMKIFKNADTYGKALNSYDVLKLVALLSMIVDHLGTYFWPDTEWLRALGRMAFPLFLFLVGYSGKWELRTDIILFAFMILACAVLTHHPVFALNILFTIAAVRYCMRYIVRRELTPRLLCGIFAFNVVWWPLFLWIEYSTAALLFALCGYLSRTKPAARETTGFLYATIGMHLVTQFVSFNFHAGANAILVTVTLLAGASMQLFRLHDILSVKEGSIVNTFLKWTARNTLPIYVFHVMLFMVGETVLFPSRTAVFHWF